MLAVRAANNSLLPDLNSVGHKRPLNDGAFLNLNARHKDTVNNPGALAHLYTGKQYGIFNFTGYNTSLGNKS